MANLNLQQRQLCDIQGRLFELDLNPVPNLSNHL